jgi:hypothetical protein
MLNFSLSGCGVVVFDYEAPDVPATTVADVVADILSHGTAPPPSPEEREQRWLANQAWREQCRARDEQRRVEYDREQAEIAERKRAIAAQAAREKAKAAARERSEQFTRELHQRELRDMRLQLAQAKSWQRDVDRAANNAMAVRRQNAAIADLEAAINPAPPPEPTVVYVEAEAGSDELGTANFNVELWSRKPRSWW